MTIKIKQLDDDYILFQEGERILLEFHGDFKIRGCDWIGGMYTGDEESIQHLIASGKNLLDFAKILTTFPKLEWDMDCDDNTIIYYIHIPNKKMKQLLNSKRYKP